MRQAGASNLLGPSVSGGDPWVRRLVLLFAVLGAYFMAVACLDWPSANLPAPCGNCRRSAWVELLEGGGLSIAVVLLNWRIAVREAPAVARWARCAALACLAMWAVAWIFLWSW